MEFMKKLDLNLLHDQWIRWKSDMKGREDRFENLSTIKLAEITFRQFFSNKKGDAL